MQGAPPDYVALRRNPHFAADPSFTDDADRLNRLPPAATELLDRYLNDVDAGHIPDDGNCCWLDLQSLQCRFYDLRPSTCRVFELNSPGCHIYRKLKGISEPVE